MPPEPWEPLHGGQGLISLEYQTYTSAHPFDTLVTGLTYDADDTQRSRVYAADADGGHFHVRQHTALRSSAEGGNFFNGTKHKMILSCKHKYKYKKHKTSQYTVTHSRFPCYLLFIFNHSNKDKLSRKIS